MKKNILLLSCLFFVSLNLCGVEWGRGWFMDRVKEMGPDGVVSYIKEVVIKDVGVKRGVLKKAMEEGKYFFVKDLMVMDVVDGKGRTVLHEAAARGEVEIVRALLDIGADVNWRDNEGRTALHEAVDTCNRKTLKWLLRHYGCYSINENGDVFHLKYSERAFSGMGIGSYCREYGIESRKDMYFDPRRVKGETLFLTYDYHTDGVAISQFMSRDKESGGLCEVVKILIEEDTDLNAKDRNDRVSLFGLNALVREFLKGEIRSNEEARNWGGHASRAGRKVLKGIYDYIFGS